MRTGKALHLVLAVLALVFSAGAQAQANEKETAGKCLAVVTVSLKGHPLDDGNMAVIPGRSHGGLATSYHYDEFGRVDSVSLPYGGGIRRTLEWAEKTDSASCVLTVREDGEPVRKTWYDCLGRKKREGVQRPDGIFLLTEFCYDSHGRLCAVSEPFKTVPALWTRHAYDFAGRLTRTVHPDGHTDTCEYDGLAVRSVTDGVQKTTVADAMGLVTAVEDGPGGGSRIAYTYRVDGKPLSVTLGGTVITAFEYDAYGRQTVITDPSAGRREWTYDASGRVACETDARGMSVRTEYTSTGLPVRRVVDGVGTFEYAYDSHSRPTSQKTGGTVTRTFSYDQYGRMTGYREGEYSKTPPNPSTLKSKI